MIAHDNSMMALTFGTLAPLHRSPLQQLISHLVTSTEGEIDLQLTALQADEVSHPLRKPSIVATELSNFTLALAQRS